MMEPLKLLLGQWEGVGKGFFPTISHFDYNETLRISSIGQSNFSWSADSFINNMPKHRETGFLKIKPESHDIALLIAENTGVVSNLIGSYCDESDCLLQLKITSASVNGTPFNKPPSVAKVERIIRLIDEEHMTQELYMATANTPDLTKHLEVSYEKK